MNEPERVIVLQDILSRTRCAYQRKRLHGLIRNSRMAEARKRGTHTRSEWLALVERYQYRCVICGCVPVGAPCKDHILPVYLGGSDHISNLQPLCRECNSAKGTDDRNWRHYRDAHGFEDCVEGAE